MRLVNITILILMLFITGEKQSYFNYVNTAEEFIINNEYSKALDVYNQMFSTFYQARSYEYYNALLCAINTNNKERATELLFKLPEKGYELDFLQNNLILPYFNNSPEWNKFLSEYDLLHQIYIEKLNDSVIVELHEMIKLDQKLSKNLMLGEVDPIIVDSLYSKNMNRIIELYNHDSFPKIECFDFNSESLRSVVPFILFRHYFGMVNRARFYSADYKGPFYNYVLNQSKKIEGICNEMVTNAIISPAIISESITYNDPNDIFGKLGMNHGRCKINKKGQEIMVEYVISRKNYSETEICRFDSLRSYWFLPDFKTAMQKDVYFNQLSDSLQDLFKYNLRLNGRLWAKETYIGTCGEDSIEFRQNCEKNLIGKHGYSLEWIYCGENGMVLPSIEDLK